MAEIKCGSRRDFNASGHHVQLASKDDFSHVAGHATSDYVVMDNLNADFYLDNNNNLVCHCDKATNYQFDNWEDAQTKYLALADQYGKTLRVREWGPKDWKTA